MENSQQQSLISEVADYYTNKIRLYGETPRGVDWNGDQSQMLRFEQLSKIILKRNDFTLNDLGCGYGALLDFLNKDFSKFSYCGIDISGEMIDVALKRYKDEDEVRFIKSSIPDVSANYGIASGIFNVRLGRADEEWFNYLVATLDILNETSSEGFAFNCLTLYSDEHKKKESLYYADPCKIFALCKKRYSKEVALLHDYGLYEFTILVRKLV